jgi:hypothetical protein
VDSWSNFLVRLKEVATCVTNKESKTRLLTVSVCIKTAGCEYTRFIKLCAILLPLRSNQKVWNPNSFTAMGPKNHFNSLEVNNKWILKLLTCTVCHVSRFTTCSQYLSQLSKCRLKFAAYFGSGSIKVQTGFSYRCSSAPRTAQWIFCILTVLILDILRFFVT